MSAPDLSPRDREVFDLIRWYARAVRLTLRFQPAGRSVASILVDASEGRAPLSGLIPKPLAWRYRIRGKDCSVQLFKHLRIYFPTPSDARCSNPGFTWWHLQRSLVASKSARRDFAHLAPTLYHDVTDLLRRGIFRPFPGNPDLLDLPAFDWVNT